MTIERAVAESPAKEYLEPAETSLIEDAAECLRDKLLIHLLRRLACRISEVLGIEERHIDFSHREVRITHKKARITRYCPFCDQDGVRTRLGKKYIVCPRCAHLVGEALTKQMNQSEFRKIPVDKETLSLIREYIKKGGVTEVDGKRMLFSISPQWARQIIRSCAKRAGFYEMVNPKNDRSHHVSPHDFRRAFATAAMQKKPSLDDARLLQELLGHKDVNTTLKYRVVKNTELHGYYDDVVEGEK